MTPTPPAPERTWIVRAIVLLSPLAFGGYALWVGQDASWDLRNYHFYNPFAFLTGRGGYDIAVAHVATYYNPLMYIPFYWAVVWLPPKAVGFLLGVIPGCNMLLLYGIAREVVRPLASPLRTAALCLAIAASGMIGQTVLAETGTSYGDTIVSLPVLAAVWLILRHRERLAHSVGSGWAVASGAGVLVGAALGVKLPFAVYAVGICAAFFALRLPFRQRFWLAFIFGLGVLAGAAVTSGFWMLEMWRRYQNPLFPYFNEVFRSPWGAIGSYRDERFIPKHLLMWLLFPFWLNYDPIRVGEIPFRDLRFPVLYVLLVALATHWLWRLRKRAPLPAGVVEADGRMPVLGFFVVLTLVCFVVWMKLFGIYRYIVVLELTAPLVAYLVLGALLRDGRRQAQAALACFLFILVTLQPGDWGRRAWSNDYFGFTPPRLPEPDRTIVLVTGHDAIAYMIPYFPPQVRFLRLQGYVTGPSDHPNETDRLMRRIVAEHTGPLYILYRVYEEWHAETTLADYRLESDPSTCITFVPGIEPQQEHDFYFCRVRKLGK